MLISLKNISGEIDAVASKSDAHRLLIAASLSDSPCVIKISTSSLDIDATCACLEAMGAKTEKQSGQITVAPIKSAPRSAVLDCGESGSTIRFLMPTAAALGIDCVFTGSGRLPERPQTPLLSALSARGVSVSPDGEFPIKISGQLQSGVFSLPGDVSSQYISGLLFALPLLDGDSEIRLTGEIQSKPYINLTVSVLNKFGIHVKESGNSYFIKGNQKYIAPKEITAEGDWSNGAFWAAVGALSDIKINGLPFSSLQGDKEIINILKRMGADVKEEENSVHVRKSRLCATEIDASDTPDLVPVAAALAVFAEGETRIYNAERLRIKESDRLSTTAELIKTAGGNIREMPDGLIIKGGAPIKKSFTVSSFNDHRLVMAAAVLSVFADVTVEKFEAVNKSYPTFAQDIAKIGGKCETVVSNNIQ